MALVEYDYTISPLAVDTLQQQVQLAGLSTVLDHIDALGSAVQIWFPSTLSTADKTTLDSVVAAHTGVGLPTDFYKVSKTTTANTTSASFVLLDSMTSLHLIAGSYFVFFRGDFSTTVPLLSNPGVTIAIFNNEVDVSDSEMTQISTNSGSLFNMVTISQMVVTANSVIDVRWKTANGAGNTITCQNRLLALIRQK